MSQCQAEVIVAGHICLDIIPTIHGKPLGTNALLVPGKLVDIGPAVISTGGAVSNTGIALHRLGSKVSLMGKVGKDRFGEAILSILSEQSPSLVDGMIIASGEHSSYSIVISPPGTDRTFLHSTGANDTYSAADLRTEQFQAARLFHFGYPPLMRSMYVNNGEELALLLKKVKDQSLTVSLDLAKPDPESDAGRVDWRSIFMNTLKYVDVFLPSFEEIVYMLHRDRFDQWMGESESGDLLPYATGDFLSQIAEELLEMGVAIVGLKLGEHGLYVRTTWHEERLAEMGLCAPNEVLCENWLDAELISSCYEVDVVGTTGAGDCTIAGFLLGLLRGTQLEHTLHTAVGVGAFNVERADAVSGIPEFSEVWKRINDGWTKRRMKLDLPNWVFHEENLWIGPHHKKSREGEKR
ncbi:Sugar or nucleoside kinase, ribokinase family [Paenibacillus sp. yr247]|uniref:carbohydrate kinase family protein n=1 Tax=Paenibacillus sp. yr247 TaxID=1761880 RepID=UPI000881124A|nr:carbohydrate kinase family protein [Paenibacillus sp. yr247]SDP11005.1 Sugar or nucleoside kinase, ribokinase family [Paenibacillus sp. yr247]